MKEAIAPSDGHEAGPHRKTRSMTQARGSSGLLAGLPDFHTLLDCQASNPGLFVFDAATVQSKPRPGRRVPRQGSATLHEVLLVVRTTQSDTTITNSR